MSDAPVDVNIAPVIPTAPAAPVPAPVSAPEPAKGKAKDEPEIVFAPTGDAGLDFAHSFLARAGISAEHPAYKAAEGGDFSLLRAELGQKALPGWEQAIALGEKAYEKTQNDLKEVVAKVGEAVLQVAEAAGVDWEATVQWARETGTDEEKAALNGLMGNPFTAKIVASYLTQKFVEQSNFEKAPASAAPAAAAPVPVQTTNTPLTRVQFSEEAAKLRNKMGDAYVNSPEYRALYNRVKR